MFRSVPVSFSTFFHDGRGDARLLGPNPVYSMGDQKCCKVLSGDDEYSHNHIKTFDNQLRFCSTVYMFTTSIAAIAISEQGHFNLLLFCVNYLYSSGIFLSKPCFACTTC